MIVNDAALELAFKGFKSRYTDACSKAQTHWGEIAMTVPSGSRDETLGWLGQFPQLREWLNGERDVKSLRAHSFAITNRKFESTVGVRREDFADDRLGVFAPMISEMGHLAALRPCTPRSSSPASWNPASANWPSTGNRSSIRITRPSMQPAPISPFRTWPMGRKPRGSSSTLPAPRAR